MLSTTHQSDEKKMGNPGWPIFALHHSHGGWPILAFLARACPELVERVGGDAAAATLVRSTLPVVYAVVVPALRKVREGRGARSCGGFCSLKAGPPARGSRFCYLRLSSWLRCPNYWYFSKWPLVLTKLLIGGRMAYNKIPKARQESNLHPR